MMIVGISTAIIWGTNPELKKLVYEVLPGMTAGILVYLIARPFIRSDMKAASEK
jgi:sodium/proline symporter